jgi:hypothetical protein
MSNRTLITFPNGRTAYRPKAIVARLSAPHHLQAARRRQLANLAYAFTCGAFAMWFVIEIVAPWIDGHVSHMIGGL